VENSAVSVLKLWRSFTFNMKDCDQTNTIIEENIGEDRDSFRMAGGLPLQCRQCRYWIKNDPLHCEKFKIFKKPGSVIWSQKKCLRFSEADYREL